jgi:hypothetical protein
MRNLNQSDDIAALCSHLLLLPSPPALLQFKKIAKKNAKRQINLQVTQTSPLLFSVEKS